VGKTFNSLLESLFPYPSFPFFFRVFFEKVFSVEFVSFPPQTLTSPILTSTHQHIDTPTHRHINTLTHRHINIQHINTSTLQHINTVTTHNTVNTNTTSTSTQTMWVPHSKLKRGEIQSKAPSTHSTSSKISYLANLSISFWDNPRASPVHLKTKSNYLWLHLTKLAVGGSVNKHYFFVVLRPTLLEWRKKWLVIREGEVKPIVISHLIAQRHKVYW
jgi:hypothetical protein